MLANFRKDRFPKGEYKKQKMKKVDLYKILRRFLVNANEIALPAGLGISPIFMLREFDAGAPLSLPLVLIYFFVSILLGFTIWFFI